MQSSSHKWAPAEIALNAEKSVENPHTDVTVMATFEHEAGERYEVTGFWNGGDEWRVRFAPPRDGTWTWETTADPSDDGLAASGELDIDPYEGENPLWNHGPLRVADDDRNLEHADGSEFFWLADTVWTASTRARPDEWDTFLDYRVDQGYNTIQMNALRQYDGSAPHERLPFGEDWNLDRPNPEHFDALDDLVRAAAERGVVTALIALWFDFVPGANLDWGIGEDHRHHVSEAQARRIGRYLGARYGAFGAVWMVSGDSGINDVCLPIYRAAAEGIEEAYPHTLLTAHQPGSQITPTSLNDEEWLDFHMYQSSHNDDMDLPAKQAREHRLLAPTRPVLNGEPCYDDLEMARSDERIDRELVRTAGWVSVLGGGNAGLTYGASGLWQWHREEDEFPGASFWGEAQGWETAMTFESSDDYALLSEIVTDYGVTELNPRPGLLPDDEPGEEAAVLPDALLVYLRDGRDVTIQHAPSVDDVFWVDPATGEESAATVTEDGGSLAVEAPPFDGNALLVGER